MQQRVTTTTLLLEDDREGDESAQIADEFGKWLIDYFQSVLLFSYSCEISVDMLMRKAQRAYHQSRGPPSMGDLAHGVNPIPLRGQPPPFSPSLFVTHVGELCRTDA